MIYVATVTNYMFRQISANYLISKAVLETKLTRQNYVIVF